MTAEDERTLVGAAKRPPLVAGRIEALLGTGPFELPAIHSCARRHVSVQATRWAPFSSPVSSFNSRNSATVLAGSRGTAAI